MRSYGDMNREETWLLEEKYNGQESADFEADCKRLAAGEPLAYVIGSMPFLGLTIALDSRPLIPRPETEWWTEELIAALREKYGDSPFRMLDLCAGSGVIGAAIAHAVPNAQVSFGEIDPKHEDTIRKNISANGIDLACSDVRIGNLLEPFAGMTFDVIATNPPYIPAERTLDASVTEWEPHEALFAGTDGLSVIRAIAAQTREHLNPGGMLWLECDSEHAEAACSLITAGGARATLRTDQYGRPRVVVGYYP